MTWIMIVIVLSNPIQITAPQEFDTEHECEMEGYETIINLKKQGAGSNYQVICEPVYRYKHLGGKTNGNTVDTVYSGT